MVIITQAIEIEFPFRDKSVLYNDSAVKLSKKIYGGDRFEETGIQKMLLSVSNACLYPGSCFFMHR